jgi:hypothetical protein
MTGRDAQVDHLLRDDESVVVRAGDERAGLLVTTHRVLAVSPATGGANYRAVARPNATDVSRETTGDRGWLFRGTRALAVGLTALVAWSLVDLEGTLAGVTVAGSAGEVVGGQVLQLLSLARTVASLLDDALLVGGALSVVAALATFAAYYTSRETVVRVSVAGDDDLSLPADAFSARDLATLSETLTGDGFESEAE